MYQGLPINFHEYLGGCPSPPEYFSLKLELHAAASQSTAKHCIGHQPPLNWIRRKDGLKLLRGQSHSIGYYPLSTNQSPHVISLLVNTKHSSRHKMIHHSDFVFISISLQGCASREPPNNTHPPTSCTAWSFSSNRDNPNNSRLRRVSSHVVRCTTTGQPLAENL